MGWLGKIVGGTIGFALGGPIGAIAGAVFGHTFDKDEAHDSVPYRDQLSDLEATQLTFFVGAFSMLAKLAQVDGHISREEIRSIEDFMARELKLSPASRQVAVDIFQSALQANKAFDDFATQFHAQFRYQPQILEFMLDILFRVSLADGRLSEAEERLIRSAAGIFNFSRSAYDHIRAKYVKDTDRFYKVLGCDSNASEEEIKHSYRKLVSEYHPDKIAAKGLPEEFSALAHDKFREIQEAYEVVKKERGIK